MLESNEESWEALQLPNDTWHIEPDRSAGTDVLTARDLDDGEDDEDDFITAILPLI